MDFTKFFTRNKEGDNNKNIKKEKIDELRNLEIKLYGEPIKSEDFKLKDEISTDEIEREIEYMKRSLNIKDEMLQKIERYEKTHKDISKEDFYKIFKEKRYADIFWIVYIKNKKGDRNDNEEERIRIRQLKNECIEIVPGEKEFIDLHHKWKEFVENVNDEHYLTNIKTYAEKFLSKNKIEKIIEPIFERHSENITDVNDVYNRLSNRFENADELRGNNIGKEMKKEIAKIIYNRLRSKKF